MDKRKGSVFPETAVFSVHRPCEQEIRRYERPETAGVRLDAEAKPK